MHLHTAQKLSYTKGNGYKSSRFWRIASRVAAQTYSGTVDGLKSMLIGKLTMVKGPAAKRESADKIVKKAEEIVNKESDMALKMPS